MIQPAIPSFSWLGVVQRVLDAMVCTAILWVLTLYRVGEFPQPYQVLAVLSVLGVWLLHPSSGVPHVRRTMGFLSEIFLLTRAWVCVWLLLLSIGFATKTSDVFSRQILLAWFSFAWFGQVVVRWVLRQGVYWLRNRGINLRRALMVGTEDLIVDMAWRLHHEPTLGVRVIGYLSNSAIIKTLAISSAHVPLTYLGKVAAIQQVVQQQTIDIVYVCLPLAQTKQVETLMTQLLPTHTAVHWAPNIFSLHLLNHNVRQVAGQPVLMLTESPIGNLGIMAKWLLDKSVSLALLLLCSPIFCCVALAIKGTSAGPVLFKQARTGLNGRIIRVYKFRTMYVHTQDKVDQAIKNDARITPLGHFLRSSSLDELPQLINVLQGRMSLVGPRPHAVQHDRHYSTLIEAYMLRHRMKPGLTGWAQVHGLRGETETLEKMRNRVQHDLHYLKNWSIWLDVLILLMTIRVVLSRKNAY